MMTSERPDLSAALDLFDRTEANLVKLEHIWEQIKVATPDGIAFGYDTPQVESLVEDFEAIAKALPAIDGYRIEASPTTPDGVASMRFDALDLGEPLAQFEVERVIQEPGKQIGLYRRRLEVARRRLVRSHALDVVASIDTVLRDVQASAGIGEWRGEGRWGELSDLVSELDRLVGAMVPRRARWSELHRHLHFAQPNDLSDIATMDWPSVKAEVEAGLYDDREPVLVSVDDLGELVRARPTGPVSTRLCWERLTDEDLERLVFELVRGADGYENADWLMHTHAPDRGRDIQVYRVIQDALSGTKRQRVIVQCKHWLTRSISVADVVACLETVRLWEPPPVDCLVITTSGRFTQDAVAWREKREHERSIPSVEYWAESHLEHLIARRPHIAVSFGLR